MVEGARLESVYTSQGYRGFESLTLRQANKKPPKRRFFLFPRVWAKLACERTEGNKKRQAQLSPFGLLEAYPKRDHEAASRLSTHEPQIIFSLNLAYFRTV